jgi:hypothetical protein
VPFCDEKERTERADIEVTDPVRLRPGGWAVAVVVVEAGAACDDRPLLVLATLATDPLHDEVCEELDRREPRRERAAAVMW